MKNETITEKYNIPAFDSIWDFAILPAFSLCEKELDDSFKKQASVFLDVDSAYKEELRKLYKNKREWLKKEYLPNESKPILDFHKLSSIVCRSLIGLKPFNFNQKKAEELCTFVSEDPSVSQPDKVKWQVNNIYVNYKASFLVAEGIVFLDLLYWAQKKINSIDELLKCKLENSDLGTQERLSKHIEIYKCFIDALNNDKKRLYHYLPTERHDDFCTSSVIALMKNDYLKRDFDYLQFSISMYQWQEYTKKQHLYDILTSKKSDLTLSELV